MFQIVGDYACKKARITKLKQQRHYMNHRLLLNCRLTLITLFTTLCWKPSMKLFLSLGESAKASIYLYLEKSVGIKKQEIPFRIDDFQNALEQVFGKGARYLEILFIKKLHEKLKATYEWGMPRCVVPELTFKDYIRLVRMDFENSNARKR